MKVAFVMPGVGVVGRGAEAFVVDLAERLAERPDFEVHLFSRGPYSGAMASDGASGAATPVRNPPATAAVPARRGSPIRHQRIRALRRDLPWVNALYGATRLGRKVFDTLFLDPLSLEWYSAAISAFPRLWRGGFDVVVMEGGLVGAWLCRLLRRLRGVPFVDIAHGLDTKWETAFARQRPDRVVTFTAAAAAMLRQRVPAVHVVVIPHGIDLSRFTPPIAAPTAILTNPAADLGAEPAELAGLPRPYILCVGAVDAHKRMHLVVEAMARMNAAQFETGRAETTAASGLPRATQPSGATTASAADIEAEPYPPHPSEAPLGSLIILGDGPEAPAVDVLARRLLGEGRYLRRVVPRAAMPAWYRAADCFTLPSRSESFGLVYLEAMACGRPVVAPDDAVRREVIGEAGVLCDVTDPDAYAAALDDGLTRTWADLPRRRAEQFPIEATVRSYAEMLLTLRPLRPLRPSRPDSRTAP